jgi:serine/threonine protein phosphatase PrpC
VTGNYRSFAAVSTGISHTKVGQVCQDCADFSDGKGLHIAVVSDGHGEANSFRSDKGASFAVRCAIGCMTEFVAKCPPAPRPEALEKMVRDLVIAVVAAWQNEVAEDYAAHPFRPEELAQCDEKHRTRFDRQENRQKAYGATLIAAAMTKNYWFGFHIGDGRFTVLYEDGSCAQPVAWDSRCYLHLTTSICDFDANERDKARVYCEVASKGANPLTPHPVAIFLCSDGIDDNYPVEENEKHLYKIYKTIALTFAEEGFEATRQQIEELCASFATKGKGDDTSLAGIIDMARIGETAKILREQPEGKDAEAKVTEEKEAEPIIEIKPVAALETLETPQAKKPEIISPEKTVNRFWRKSKKTSFFVMGITLVAILTYIAHDKGNTETKQIPLESSTQTPTEAVKPSKPVEPTEPVVPEPVVPEPAKPIESGKPIQFTLTEHAPFGGCHPPPTNTTVSFYRENNPG